MSESESEAPSSIINQRNGRLRKNGAAPRYDSDDEEGKRPSDIPLTETIITSSMARKIDRADYEYYYFKRDPTIDKLTK